MVMLLSAKPPTVRFARSPRGELIYASYNAPGPFVGVTFGVQFRGFSNWLSSEPVHTKALTCAVSHGGNTSRLMSSRIRAVWKNPRTSSFRYQFPIRFLRITSRQPCLGSEPRFNDLNRTFQPE